MLKTTEISHINLDEISQMKIPALSGRARTNNLLILETIATEGPLLKYDVYKRLKKRGITEYSTVTRRIDSLKEKGYLNEAGRRSTARGKQKEESTYGLTWKGFIASFLSEQVRQDVLQVIEKNPLLTIPEKQFVLLILKEVFDSKEIEKITHLLLYGCLKVIPNLENIKEEELWMWILHGTREIPSNINKVNEIPAKKKDLTRLLDNPRILQYVKGRILPIISEWERNFYVLYQFFKELNQLGDVIKELRPEDKPSETLKEYLKAEKLEETMPKLET